MSGVQIEHGEPMVTRQNFLDMQVCIPEAWTDAQAVEFAERENRCGTMGGWQIRRAGSPYLQGDPERQCCEGRAGFVHLMLDC